MTESRASTPAAVGPEAIGRATVAMRATYAAFIGAGFAFASWAARIPQIRDRLGLSPSELGLVLLALALGSVLALPSSGPLITRIGSRRTVILMALLLGVAMLVVAVGYRTGVTTVVVGLFLLGLSNGTWDVAMNVQGARVERLLQRDIMARFHAGFSLGTVAGALVGALMVALDVSVTAHLIGVGALLALVVPLAARGFVPDVDDAPGLCGSGDTAAEAPQVRALTAWTEPRTLLIGLFVLAFAFAEGTANDWIAVALIDGYGASETVATLGFAVFLTAMTTARWFGPAGLERWGRVPVVRAIAVICLLGLGLFVLGPSVGVAMVGAFLWGVGASLGFPVGMSAAADDAARSAARVSVVASIGYCAFLAGPPLIGFLGEATSVLTSLWAVAALLVVATAVSRAVAPPDAD